MGNVDFIILNSPGEVKYFLYETQFLDNLYNFFYKIGGTLEKLS